MMEEETRDYPEETFMILGKNPPSYLFYVHFHGRNEEPLEEYIKDFREGGDIQSMNNKSDGKTSIEFDLRDCIRPAPVAYRMYDSLAAPYSKSCSKLCNHPMSNRRREDFTNRVSKISWGLPEDKTILLPNEEQSFNKHFKSCEEDSHDSSSLSNSLGGDDDEDIIPQELLMKYTKIDSPTPSGTTMFSTGAMRATQNTPTTRSQSASSTRRCITPENDEINHEKRVIVLDLRRSKSTDALSGGNEAPPTLSTAESESVPPPKGTDGSTKSSSDPVKSRPSNKIKAKQPSIESSPTKGSTAHRQTEAKTSGGSPTPSNSSTAMNSNLGKGSKKKKKKFARHKIRSDSPDKENFYDIEDPGDTQIASSSTGNANNDSNEKNTDSSKSRGSNKPNASVTHEKRDDLNEQSSASFHSAERLLQEFVGRDDVSFMDKPLERRALLSLKRQLEMEKLDQSFDLNVG